MGFFQARANARSPQIAPPPVTTPQSVRLSSTRPNPETFRNPLRHNKEVNLRDIAALPSESRPATAFLEAEDSRNECKEIGQAAARTNVHAHALRILADPMRPCTIPDAESASRRFAPRRHSKSHLRQLGNAGHGRRR